MHVYIISNEAFPGWLKVGKTGNITSRLSALQVGSPVDYSVDLLIEFFDDRPLHNKLEALGIERKGEWFKATNAEVRRVILETIAEFDASERALSTGKNQAEKAHEGVKLTGLEPVSRRKQAGQEVIATH